MSFRKILFWIHLAAGCVAGLVILVMSVTGVLMTYERQVIGWADRGMRSSPSGSGKLPIEAVVAGVVAENSTVPTAIAVHAEADAPVEVSFGRDRVVLVDRYSGKVLGESSPGVRSFFESMENLHRWLGAGTEHRPAARAITGACNFGFLILVVSGPFLWIPRKWSWQNVKALATFRWGLSGRARDFNWHNVIGIWCAVPLSLIVLSGVVMSYPWANNLLYRVTGSEPPAAGAGGPRGQAGERRGGGPQGGDSGQASLAGLNTLWTKAEQQVPDWRSVTLRLPPAGRGPMTFTIDTGNGGRPDQRSQLTLNRRSGEVVRWEPFTSYNAGRRLRGWFRFLHTGEAGGVSGQTIAGVASAGGVVLVWTGLCLAWRRWMRWRRTERGGLR